MNDLENYVIPMLFRSFTILSEKNKDGTNLSGKNIEGVKISRKIINPAINLFMHKLSRREI